MEKETVRMCKLEIYVDKTILFCEESHHDRTTRLTQPSEMK